MIPVSSPSEPGAPVPESHVPLIAPEIGGNEWRYIKECLDSAWVSSVGAFVTRFEGEIAARVGTRFAVATVNGTAALHIAALVAGVEPDDEVLVSALSFVAPANAVRYLGAWPVFIDAEPKHWQMDPQRVAEFLERECERARGALRNRATGRRVRALLPVHILGHPVNMEPILEMARKHGLAVIEDAAEALGAKCDARMVGSLGDVGCFSFNGNKIITTGGGGMIVTDNEEWAQRARYLTTQAKDNPVEYIHREIGYNYRLSNVQAAMGCAQLERLDEFIAAKRRLADLYRERLADVPGISPMREAPWAFSTHWMFTVLVDREECGMDSRALMRRLAEEGIHTRPLWQPLHLSESQAGAPPRRCEVAERLARDALSLPCSAGLQESDLRRVCEAIRQCAQTTRR
jgi:perosamine synthetase